MPAEEDDEENIVSTTFTSAVTAYDRTTTIHHWQLRDLISAADNEYEFFCVDEQQVFSYNVKNKESKVVANLDFAPTSMTCRRGFLAAGGAHGELEVRDLSRGEVCFKGRVGSTVNNALHVAPHSNGEDRLYVCCNDSTVKVFALPSMSAVTVLRCPCPINYVALSPDGTTLVAVGDCDPTYLYQATPSGYSLLTSFTEACDVGMCCAWNTHGTLLASCHQDGAVAVWDARSGGCVSRMALSNAARCIKFSAAPMDLLAVSEHDSSVVLVDSRAWHMRQTVLVPPGPHHGSPGGRGMDISGLAFTPSGSRLWVGMDTCCVGVDVDSVKRRTFGVSGVL